jgi:peptide/nickel transport system ATP-binding protein
LWCRWQSASRNPGVHSLESTSWRYSSYDGVVASLLQVAGLTVELPTPQGWIRPVQGVSFNIEEGEVLGVVGESGSGKTMLALVLMGLLPRSSRTTGEVFLRSRASQDGGAHLQRANLLAAPPSEMRAIRGREIAIIFQEPLSALNPVMRAGAQIEEAVRAHQPQWSARKVRELALESMRRAAISQAEFRAAQYPHQLSGGLRQRAMIAMALASGPRLLIADEPTTALDPTIQKQILELLRRLRDELHLAILFITHDLAVAHEIADRLCVMQAGRFVEEGPAGEVLTRPRHAYTERLLRAAPRLLQGATAS